MEFQTRLDKSFYRSQKSHENLFDKARLKKDKLKMTYHALVYSSQSMNQRILSKSEKKAYYKNAKNQVEYQKKT